MRKREADLPIEPKTTMCSQSRAENTNARAACRLEK
jgi:hypothetical protein